MSAIGVAFSPLEETPGVSVFAAYRKRGGESGPMIPDLMIAAQALRHGSSLATADRDFMSAQLPELKIFQP